MTEAKFTTVHDILNRDDIKKNERVIESCHLHFNGPGAAGFGVKRTAMLLPESVMLLVAPSCCGRHGTVTGNNTGFDDRMFYLQITERDLVTGKYLSRIPEAAKLVAARGPKVIFLCMTCVDAIMGTDLERIARKVETETGIKTVGSFMDPISREGRKAPMVSVRRGIMGALEPLEAGTGLDKKAVNIIGDYVPVDAESDLYKAFADKGFEKVRQISACRTYEEYKQMNQASLDVVISPQGVAAAADMEKKLGIPYVHLRNCFGPGRIEKEYQKLGYKDDFAKEQVMGKLRDFAKKHEGLKFGIGEAVNGNNLELALTLLEAGVNVSYVYKNILGDYEMEMFAEIAKIKPELKVYSGVHPSMSGAELEPVDVAIGLDAGYVSKEASSVCWNMERQAFGYQGIHALLAEIEARIENPIPHKEQIHGSYLTI